MSFSLARFLKQAAIVSCLWLTACATNGAVDTPSPLPLPRVVASPVAGSVTMVAVKAPQAGNILPVYVSIANGTNHPISETPLEVFAKGEDGNRVPPVPLQEAEVQAGGAARIVSSFETAVAYGLPAAAIGGMMGAAVGSSIGWGTWVGAEHGILVAAPAFAILGATIGLHQAHVAAEQRAKEQVLNLSLKGDTVPPNGTVSGYVFYPAGKYVAVEAVIADKETDSSYTLVTNLR